MCFEVSSAIMLITYFLFLTYFSEFDCKILNFMGRKVLLTADDRKTTTKRLAEGSSAIEISKESKRQELL